VDIDQIAKVAHEINAALCLAFGDMTQPSWENAPQWQKDSAMDCVRFYLGNPEAGPGASHDNWLAEKRNDGWRWGEVRDPEAKTHPCMIPFVFLAREQQAKDFLFRQVVHSCVAAKNDLKFNRGFMCAVADIARNYSHCIAANVLNGNGMDELDCSGIDEFDKVALRKLMEVEDLGLTGLQPTTGETKK